MLQSVILKTPSTPEIMQVERRSWSVPCDCRILPSHPHSPCSWSQSFVTIFFSVPYLRVEHSVRDRRPFRSSQFCLGLTFLNYVSDLCMGHLKTGSHFKPRWFLACVFIGCILGNSNLELAVITRVELSSLFDLVNDQLDARFFFHMFISILYIFRATSCLSSGESIALIQHLVYVTLFHYVSDLCKGHLKSGSHFKPQWFLVCVCVCVCVFIGCILGNTNLELAVITRVELSSLFDLVNDQLDARFFFYIFISILYIFRATSCSSSGESIVSIQHLLCVTLCRWPSSMQVGKELTDLHNRRSPTQSDTYQMFYWYNWFSWWWARGCSKRVENWYKQI
jgi:hypothetical protein